MLWSSLAATVILTFLIEKIKKKNCSFQLREFFTQSLSGTCIFFFFFFGGGGERRRGKVVYFLKGIFE